MTLCAPIESRSIPRYQLVTNPVHGEYLEELTMGLLPDIDSNEPCFVMQSSVSKVGFESRRYSTRLDKKEHPHETSTIVTENCHVPGSAQGSHFFRITEIHGTMTKLLGCVIVHSRRKGVKESIRYRTSFTRSKLALQRYF